MKDLYRLKYTLETGLFDKPKNPAESDFGLTDEILFCSYLESPEGAGSYLWMSSNGNYEQMDWDRRVHCLFTLVSKLEAEAPLDRPFIKRILGEFMDEFRKYKSASRNN